MQLNIKQRFFVVGLYLTILICLGYYFSNDFKFIYDSTDKLNIVFIATSLTLLLSAYILEPFFTKPVDVVARWVAVFLFVIGLKDMKELMLYQYWLHVSVIFIILALTSIFIHGFKVFEKQQKAFTNLICTISRPEYVFSALYFDLICSFFRTDAGKFPILIGFGFLLVINKPIHLLTIGIWRLFNYLLSESRQIEYIGKIIGTDSEELHTVEITSDSDHTNSSLIGRLVALDNNNISYVGIVLNEKFLVGKKWVQIRMLRDEKKHLLLYHSQSRNLLNGVKSIYSNENNVRLLGDNELPYEIDCLAENNSVVNNYNNIIGYIWVGSTINKIKFYSMITEQLIKEKGIGEGSIIQSIIAEEEVLFQIIDARTDEENLEYKDSHGFTIATAQKLGKYDCLTNELATVKWLPNIYDNVFLLKPKDIAYDPKNFIGRLPKTNYGIPIKNINELVTHNTAILGILGIGKSCLTFELIQKLIDTTEVKIICIDITNEYHKADKLPMYINVQLITHDKEDAFNSINGRYDFIDNSNNKQNPETSGNISEYHTAIAADLKMFLYSSDQIPTDFKQTQNKRIRIYNPDYHKVSKGEKIGYNVLASPLTQAEKTRVICEEILKLLMKLPIDDSGKAKILVVFEEAHSLVPEWNSVANEGDKSATNGTAKVILQGRKYGLGSMVITQRTANISKSILNQCNTIFALRVFDDTGKQFLENYIGSDYSNLLPTLEERHAVVIGKALKLKQPVIIELNDRELLIRREVQTEEANQSDIK